MNSSQSIICYGNPCSLVLCAIRQFCTHTPSSNDCNPHHFLALSATTGNFSTSGIEPLLPTHNSPSGDICSHLCSSSISTSQCHLITACFDSTSVAPASLAPSSPSKYSSLLDRSTFYCSRRWAWDSQDLTWNNQHWFWSNQHWVWSSQR